MILSTTQVSGAPGFFHSFPPFQMARYALSRISGTTVVLVGVLGYCWYYFSNIFIENPPFNVPLEYKSRLNISIQLVIIFTLLIPFYKKHWSIWILSDIAIIAVILTFFR